MPDRAVLQPVAQRLDVQRPFDRQEAAEAVQREAEAELDLRQEMHADDDDEGERIGADQADRGNADLGELKIEDAAVFLGRLGVAQEAAALDHPGIDPQSGGERRLRRHVQRRRRRSS